MDTTKEDKAEKGQAAYTDPSPTALDTPVATEDEIRDLEHVAACLPARVWLAAAIGMAEQFAYYGTQSLFHKCTSCLFKVSTHLTYYPSGTEFYRELSPEQPG